MHLCCYLPSSGMAGHRVCIYGTWVQNLKWLYQFTVQIKAIYAPPASSPTFHIVGLFTFSHGGQNVPVFHCGFSFHFPDDKGGWIHFNMFIGHLDYFKGPHQVLCQLLIRLCVGFKLYALPPTVLLIPILESLATCPMDCASSPCCCLLSYTTGCLGLPHCEGWSLTWSPSCPSCWSCSTSGSQAQPIRLWRVSFSYHFPRGYLERPGDLTQKCKKVN